MGLKHRINWYSLGQTYVRQPGIQGIRPSKITHLSLGANHSLRNKRAWVLVNFSRIRLCDPVDCSPPGSSVHGILQTRTLKWVAMPFFRGSFRPRDRTAISWGSCTAGGFIYLFIYFTAESLGKPRNKQRSADNQRLANAQMQHFHLRILS